MKRSEALKTVVVPQNAHPWWKGAAIYQIYPRSFADSNGDGIGDLPGITGRLDYIADLGFDAIWIAPFFTSPMLDFGYDVSAFRDVDPIFGTLADFDALIVRAHQLGLKVIIDQVYSHSSDQHRWFEESRHSRDNPKADWYVWADPKPDGTPPNNWQSIFSGPAWSWDARRGQYYFHNFLQQQPDLNLHNADVQDALLDTGRFWLDRGVDGFRIDAVLHMMHDPLLRDNPPTRDNAKLKARGHDFQDNIYNQGHPGILQFLSRVRKLTDEYGDIFTVAEVGGTGAGSFLQSCAEGSDRLHSAYGFDFLYASELSPDLVCTALRQWPDDGRTGWPTWAFENHDAPRAVSRWARPGWDADSFSRMKMAVLCALRGNIIVYQGEELGLDQVEIPYDQIKDPEALKNWPLTLSRDGARTPMPWAADAHNHGFSDGHSWLPFGENHGPLAVDRQGNRPDSMMSLTRQLLALRTENPALRWGEIVDCRVEGDVLILKRQAEGQTVVAIFNMSAETVPTPAIADANTPLLALNGADNAILPPFGVLFLQCAGGGK